METLRDSCLDLVKHDPAGWFTIEPTAHGYTLKAPFGTAQVNIYPIKDKELVEMSVVNPKTMDTDYYLHFELDDFEHFVHLYEEMKADLLKLKEVKVYKIIIACTSGLSASRFAQKMRDAAANLALDYEIKAVPYQQLYKEAVDYDLVLISPQLNSMVRIIKGILSKKNIVTIPGNIYSKFDAMAMIKIIEDQYHAQNAKNDDGPEKFKTDEKANILSIVLIPNSVHSRILYRVYRQRDIMLDNSIVKDSEKILIQDIADIVEMVKPAFPDLDCIGICITGIVDNGVVSLSKDNFDITLNDGTQSKYEIPSQDESKYHFDLKTCFESKYDIPVFVDNNANLAALGYHTYHRQYHNMIFHSQPTGYLYGGQGVIVNDHLLHGKHNLCGEVQYLIRSIHPEDPSDGWNPDHVLQVVTQSLLASISIIAPDAIVFRCSMIPDKEDLRQELLKSLGDEKYLPVLVKVSEPSEYMFTGCLRHCLHELKVYKKVL